MCGRLSTLEMAITCTGTCTALAGIDGMGAKVRKRGPTTEGENHRSHPDQDQQRHNES